jgi:hypothetical protein
VAAIQFPYDDKVHPAPCELRWLGAVSEWDGKPKAICGGSPPRGAPNASRRGQRRCCVIDLARRNALDVDGVADDISGAFSAWGL